MHYTFINGYELKILPWKHRGTDGDKRQIRMY